MSIVWGSLGQLAAVAALCSILFWGTAGWALSSALQQRVWIGAVVGGLFAVLGLIGLGIAGAIGAGRRRAAREKQAVALPIGEAGAVATTAEPGKPDRPKRRWTTAGPRILAVGLVLVACGLLVSSDVLPWAVLRTGVIPALVFVPIGTGFDIVIYVTAAAVLIAAIFLIWRPFRWAAVLLAWIADWWLFGLLAGLVLQAGLTTALSSVRFSLGDLLTDFGMGKDSGLIGSSSSAGGLSIDLRGVDLTEPLRHAGVDVGPSWIVLLLFILMANVALFIALRHRPAPSP